MVNANASIHSISVKLVRHTSHALLASTNKRVRISALPVAITAMSVQMKLVFALDVPLTFTKLKAELIVRLIHLHACTLSVLSKLLSPHSA